MAFLAVNPDSFAACAGMVNEIPLDALKKLATHTLKACQRKKLPPSVEEYGKKLRQGGIEVSDRLVKSVVNWLVYLYGEAVRNAVTEDQFGKRLRKTARQLNAENLELLAALWAKEGTNYEPPTSLCATPQLLSLDWRIAFPVQHANEPPNLSIVFNTQTPSGALEPCAANLPYSSFLQFSKSIKQAHEALLAASAPAGAQEG
eukprot:TRINITY_DN21356_c0_g1_i1.p1 TRINITY_DN21356_c0_g1~~TRINITY_DN21356_c0_g1_i1.p1  ORF type:complete len:215 (+),score=23.80 TRINITY_DN21356_c0_g1_i1:39-647(+)